MSKNRSALVGTLVTVGALGAMAGMLAWRFSQRHRLQRQTFHRDLSRWEGEGGSLAGTTGNNGEAPDMAMVAGATDLPEPGGKSRAANGANGAMNGSDGMPWPFPHG
ncbi:hypothetical protein [Paraburkholderia sp. J76]|uniref:hypothetical protein n=1 Tax=Paraburkholderia sp. J76 TaxID=2805439 RepID=UPI002ABE99E5|nr:hypothetical protein [Paraburkholderia sp. J76]